MVSTTWTSVEILPAAARDNFEIVKNECKGSFPPGSSCELKVVFMPQAAGPSSGAVSAQTASLNWATVPLEGEGVAAGELKIEPNPYEFPKQVAGDGPGKAEDFAIENIGSGPVELKRIYLEGEERSQFVLKDPSSCKGMVLPGGGKCTVQVAFDPTSEGTKTVALEVETEAGPGQAAAHLTGIGTGSNVVLNPPEHDFGELNKGEFSKPFPFYIENNGDTEETVYSPPIPTGNQFGIEDGNCKKGLLLKPGEKCTTEVVFEPSGTEGEKEAELQALSSAGPSSPI